MAAACRSVILQIINKKVFTLIVLGGVLANLPRNLPDLEIREVVTGARKHRRARYF
jgi:hypothetical protein